MFENAAEVVGRRARAARKEASEKSKQNRKRRTRKAREFAELHGKRFRRPAVAGA